MMIGSFVNTFVARLTDFGASSSPSPQSVFETGRSLATTAHGALTVEGSSGTNTRCDSASGDPPRDALPQDHATLSQPCTEGWGGSRKDLQRSRPGGEDFVPSSARLYHSGAERSFANAAARLYEPAANMTEAVSSRSEVEEANNMSNVCHWNTGTQGMCCSCFCSVSFSCCCCYWLLPFAQTSVVL